MLPEREIADFYLKKYRLEFDSHVNSKPEERERAAQKEAIAFSFRHFFVHFPWNAEGVWAALQKAHIMRKANIDFLLSPEQIDAVVSADQSWKKSSGHAAEAFLADYCTEKLKTKGIQFLLQKDLSALLSEERVKNDPRDLVTLRSWIESSAFDLYACKVDVTRRHYVVFGCIQSKTSIRDRVTRDREPSLIAMSHFFWSAAIVIDGAFLRLPKFQGMVNGGTSDYDLPGWHGMYSLSQIETVKRIFKLDVALEPLISHTIRASEQFTTNRQWLTADWRP